MQETSLRTQVRDSDSRQIIDFSLSFIFNDFIKQKNIIFDFCDQDKHDSILSLIFYRITETRVFSFAKDWWDGDYCRYI